MFFEELKLPYYLLTVSFLFFMGVGSLLYKLTRKSELKAFVLIVVGLALCSISILYGWRYIAIGYGGIDASAYKIIFNKIDPESLYSILELRVEKGYGTLMWVVKSLGLPIHAFNFIFSFILTSIIFYVVILLPTTLFSLISVLLFSILYIDSFNISRMIIAIFILFVAAQKLKRLKHFQSFALSLLAASFQMVGGWGIVFILYTWAKGKIGNNFKFFLFYLISVVSAFLIVNVFKFILVFIGYGYYVVDEVSFSLLNYIFCAYLYFIYYFFISRDDTYHISTSSNIVFQLLPTMAFSLPLYMAVPIAYRFNYIYMLFFFFVIAEVLKWSTKKLKERKYAIFFIGFLPPLIYSFLKLYAYFERDVYSAQIWLLDRSLFFW
ncbi:EpsG family protein [Vibrio parahaemolyticus]|nr:EpsG family protein [Vibrio parahaemolyticus]EIZ1175198.1 EpsG family protein [Vibrio parahaemolyticus]EJE8529174.1 EpsG family protein [Vibrio parahaemolyticus]EJG1098543.1 EpsG family protein [Vibrio parahaemolyticus]